MRQSIPTTNTFQPDAVTLAAATWLASGIVLLGLTPLPWHDTTLGWSPAFWLLAAPCVLLLVRLLCVRQVSRDEAARGRRAHNRTTRRSGTYAPTREHGEHRRHANRPAQRAG